MYISVGHYNTSLPTPVLSTANSISLCFAIHTQAVPVSSSRAFSTVAFFVVPRFPVPRFQRPPSKQPEQQQQQLLVMWQKSQWCTSLAAFHARCLQCLLLKQFNSSATRRLQKQTQQMNGSLWLFIPSRDRVTAEWGISTRRLHTYRWVLVYFETSSYGTAVSSRFSLSWNIRCHKSFIVVEFCSIKSVRLFRAFRLDLSTSWFYFIFFDFNLARRYVHLAKLQIQKLCYMWKLL